MFQKRGTRVYVRNTSVVDGPEGRRPRDWMRMGLGVRWYNESYKDTSDRNDLSPFPRDGDQEPYQERLRVEVVSVPFCTGGDGVGFVPVEGSSGTPNTYGTETSLVTDLSIGRSRGSRKRGGVFR